MECIEGAALIQQAMRKAPGDSMPEETTADHVARAEGSSARVPSRCGAGTRGSE